MTYQEAKDLSLTVKWKTTVCQSGDVCWCRIIEPQERIEDKDGNEIYIAASGCVPKEYAEHIVELHNRWVNEKVFREFGKKLMSYEEPINDTGIQLTDKDMWDLLDKQ